MLARELISDSIPSVKKSDKASTVLSWMNEFRVGQMPIVENEELLGLVTEDDLLESENEELPQSH